MNRKTCFLFIGICLCAFSDVIAFPLNSAHYELSDGVYDSAGDQVASARYSLVTAIGQGGEIGALSSPAYTNEIGFLHSSFIEITPTPSPTATPAGVGDWMLIVY